MHPRELCLALDLGTTTLAGRLVDSAGALLAEARAVNPQARLAGDVIRRMELALKGEGGRLRSQLLEGIDALLEALCREAGAGRSSIGRAAAAGNPAICHLLMGWEVEPLLFPPHRPRHPAGTTVDLPEVLDAPVYLFPLVSGYVGGDLVAFIYGAEEALTSPLTPHPSRFFLDVGTNGEMALCHGGRWWVSSVAAGPAFEGGEIACGMPVGEGAVFGVAIEADSFALRVVGGGVPRGICGSGVAEAVAAARQGGLVDASGTLVDPLEVPTNLGRQIVEKDGKRLLRLYRDARTDLCLSQQEIRSFQLAKGAIRAGAECLLDRAGVTAAELEEVLVTGAFGLTLSRPVLKRVAMLPKNMVDRVRFVADGALAGAARFLGDPEGERRVAALAASMKPFPMSGTPAFEKAFLNALDF